MQALVETIVVPETWFYRDVEAFRALARLARERLDQRGTALPLRVLSLPCSTGEEPYTIAMTLLDAGIDAAHLRIDAMDISDRSLAFAQRAVYGRNSFRGSAFPFRDAHFTRGEAGWELAPRIAETVRFSRANLMQLDTALLGVYDFVFCRNVLIYFDREAQQTALHALNSVLADGGTLFVGPSETGLLMRYGMHSAKIPLAFAFHRAAPVDGPANVPVEVPAAPLATAAALAPLHLYSAEPFAWPDPVSPTLMPFNGTVQSQTRDANAPSIAPTAKRPLQPLDLTPQPTNAARDSLQAAHALADAGRLADAVTSINVYLEHHAPHADAFYLLGVLADASGETNAARGHYRKALYLDPQHAEALAHLATLLELEGDRNGARLLMQRASRAQGAPRG
jgi:chemotaxis protein methyltransferase WspC